MTSMDRYWFLTWTTYGTWLPGDERGFVSSVRMNSGQSEIHNRLGDDIDGDRPALQQFSERRMSQNAVFLTPADAVLVADQFAETARFRGWSIPALAIMRNHIHLVVGVSGDPDPEVLLRDFKSYASRKLNSQRSGQQNWWTRSGSTRKLKDRLAVLGAIRYTRDQEYPLVVRIDPEWAIDINGEPPASAGVSHPASVALAIDLTAPP